MGTSPSHMRRRRRAATVDVDDATRDEVAFRIASETPVEELYEKAKELGIDYEAGLKRLADSDLCAKSRKGRKGK